MKGFSIPHRRPEDRPSAERRRRLLQFLRLTTLQGKLVWTFLLTSTLILAVNIFLFININRSISRIDRVYLSNVQLSRLSDELAATRTQMTDYLSTKSSESLGLFYEAEDNYNTLLGSMRLDEESEHVQMMLADVRHLSGSYLAACESALSAKRGRNIQKYKDSYDEATRLYEYVSSYLYSLNNVQLGNNSTNYSALRQSFHSLEMVTLLVLALVTLTNLLITLALTKALTDPLSILARQADEISAGNFSVPALEVRSEDEIGTVSAAFNEMVVSIRGYIEQLRTSMENENRMKEKELLMDAHLKEAELKYLQAQINPHFLFNTLNAGAQLAMMEDADRCYRYLQNVAAFFRSKTNREKQVTTLADEIALTDSYLYIINVRFAGEIAYDKRVDDDLTHVSVPSMILQPIVENAVNHGIRDIDWPPRITLCVYRTGDSITIAVRDNGRGMPPEQIADILSGRTPERERGDETNGVGLGNVVSRLRLFYDREDVFDITSAGPGQGTEVLLYLPMPD